MMSQSEISMSAIREPIRRSPRLMSTMRSVPSETSTIFPKKMTRYTQMVPVARNAENASKNAVMSLLPPVIYTHYGIGRRGNQPPMRMRSVAISSRNFASCSTNTIVGFPVERSASICMRESTST